MHLLHYQLVTNMLILLSLGLIPRGLPCQLLLFCGSRPQNSKFIHKCHNVTVLLYHLVSNVKYRRVVITDSVDKVLVDACAEIEKGFEGFFLEVGIDKDHVHFLIQSVPSYSVTKIVTMVKSIIAREVFMQSPEVKKQLWGR